MKQLDKAMAKAARKLTEANVNGVACFWVLYQEKIPEGVKTKLKKK